MFLTNSLFRTAQLHGGIRSAVLGARSFTWAQTCERVRRLAGALRARGLSGGERIAVLALNGVEYLELTYAAPLAGLTLVPLNTRLSISELQAQIADCSAAALVFDDANRASAAALAGLGLRLVVALGPQGAAAGAVAYEEMVASAAASDQVATDREASWAIIYTGGTTGPPKGVVLSHRAITHDVTQVLADLQWGAQTRFLQATPLFHLAGLGPSYAVSAQGGTHHFLPVFVMEDFLALMAGERIEATALVPTMIGWLVNHPDLARHDLSAFRHLGYGASAIPEPVLRKAMTLFPGLSLAQFYGQTEVCGALTSLRAEHHDLAPDKAHRLRSAGLPRPGVRVEIRDEHGLEVARGVWGEITGRSEGVFSGYLNQPELTASTMRDGWVRTGDVGYMDDDGFVYVTDRLKDMIVTGGENVSSSEVESVLARHPGVLQAAVIAAPDPQWGERVHAVVCVRPGDTVTAEEIMEFCRQSMSGYKRPRSVDIRQTPLPTSAIGKIRKDLLRKELIAQKEAAHGA